MKVLLYSEMMEKIAKSGLGLAIYHQQKALERAGVEYTLDPNDDFDILHINTYFLKSYQLAKKCKDKGIPIVYHAHSTMEDFKNSFKLSNLMAPFFKRCLLLCYKLGDVIITPSEYSKTILQSYGLDQEIYVVSNGVDVSAFSTQNNTRELLRKNYGFSKDDFVVMGMGLFIERKGILDFLKLAERMPDIRFIWFGYTDFKLVPKNIRLAILNHPKNVTFAGYVPNDKIKTAFQASDVFLMPTYEETEGIPVLEACASRIPIILRDIPVFRPWLVDKKHVYKATNIAGFEYMLRRMQAKELPDLSENAYNFVKTRDLSVIGEKLKSIYLSVIQNYKPKAKLSTLRAIPER